jgi:hypothetical protein
VSGQPTGLAEEPSSSAESSSRTVSCTLLDVVETLTRRHRGCEMLHRIPPRIALYLRASSGQVAHDDIRRRRSRASQSQTRLLCTHGRDHCRLRELILLFLIFPDLSLGRMQVSRDLTMPDEAYLLIDPVPPSQIRGHDAPR